ncbi:hypothetical protein N7495_007212 [Penicillium taxi]|uniref:uncharacterized protein n=1 Tax=Penicillium taxi TaxID=168475 RepID=UPI00254544FD|nr:uncharacterized protein N7495_007212 [Penicillium taxi]KAJ5895521.1 hypothetical protein N7495_007212 [Penicillium taxi]
MRFESSNHFFRCLKVSSVLAPSLSALSITTRTPQIWKITEKLSENAQHLNYEDIQEGLGYSRAIGKFLCYLVDDPTKIGFMRIYCQIPIEETDEDSIEQQAIPAPVCAEFEVLMRLRYCPVAPQILGHAVGTQPENGFVPRG